jgi:hypothetical protein
MYYTGLIILIILSQCNTNRSAGKITFNKIKSNSTLIIVEINSRIFNFNQPLDVVDDYPMIDLICGSIFLDSLTVSEIKRFVFNRFADILIIQSQHLNVR